MKWIAGLALALLISLSFGGNASAEVLCDTVDEICIPSNITWGAQIVWQGHAITKAVKDADGGYTVQVARDSEPHEYPYFNAKFTADWEYVGTTVKTDPAAIKKAEQDKAKAEQDRLKAEQDKQRADQEAQRAEQDRQRQAEEERRKPKPDQPPATKPDDPPTPTEPPDEEPTNGGE